jgi:hypothetical protein
VRIARRACLGLLVLLAFAATAPVFARDDASAYFRAGRIVELAIELSAESAAALRQDPRAYVRCTLREGDRIVSENAGIKLKGAAGSFREFDDRPALTVNLDKFGPAKPWNGLEKFHLNNSVQDESLLSEWIASEVIRSAGQPATRVAHARVRLGERDLGVYVLKESFDEHFLARSFRNASGNLYDGGFCQDIDGELGRDEGDVGEERADLRLIAQACAEPDMKQRWKRLEQLVDIGDFVRFMALEAMLGHWDGYTFNTNNYRVYLEPGRKARFLCHGMDQCFQDPSMSVLGAPISMVGRSVMRNPEWRKLYRREIVRLLDEFDAARIARRVEPVQRRLQDALRGVGVEAAAAQADRARELMERVEARARSLREQSAAPEPKPPTFRKGQAVRIAGWHPMSESEDATVEEIELGGARWYRVACGDSGRCIAGWRCSVLLAKGRYRFEALMRVDGVEKLAEDNGAPGIGAGIRTADRARSAEGTGSGERTVAFEFEVAEEVADVDLVLELRASRGSTAFRVDSLTITRE